MTTTTTFRALIAAICLGRLGRPFNPRYPGRCALLGSKLNPWDQARCVQLADGSTAYVAQASLERLPIPSQVDLAGVDAALRNFQPYSLELLKDWTAGGATVSVHLAARSNPAPVAVKRSGDRYSLRGSVVTEAQLAQRLRRAAWLHRSIWS